MKLKLPAVVLSILKRRGAVRDETLRVSRSKLVEVCKGFGYVPHAAVIAFESSYGGLLIPDESPKTATAIKKGEPAWLFGAHTCLTIGGHASPRDGGKARKLVPVVNSPNDIIYYLDEKGHAFGKDTIGDTAPSFYAEDKTSLVCRIVFDDALFSRKDSSLDFPGLQGQMLAKRLSLKFVKEASGKDRRFYTDAKGDILVVEDVKLKQTRFAGANQKLLKTVASMSPSKKDNQSPEVAPYLGKSYVRLVGEERTSLPDIFDQLPDLRELEVSINKLASLPESLWRASKLTSLDVSFNPIREVPVGIANLGALKSLSLRGCPIKTLPEALAGTKNLTNLNLGECAALDVDAALSVIAKLPKLQDLTLPLSHSLTSLAPLSVLPLKSLYLNGASVPHPTRIPSGLGQLKKLVDLRIEYADDINELPLAPDDIKALRLIFSKKFTDDDIRRSIEKQPEKLYLKAFARTL